MKMKFHIKRGKMDCPIRCWDQKLRFLKYHSQTKINSGYLKDYNVKTLEHLGGCLCNAEVEKSY